MSRTHADRVESCRDACGWPRWHRWSAAAWVMSLSLLVSACGGARDAADAEASASLSTAAATAGERVRAMALTPTTPLLLEDTFYALRSVGSPELVLSEQGVGSTLTVAAVSPTAAVPETARFRLLPNPNVSGPSTWGCVYLEAQRLGTAAGSSVDEPMWLDVNRTTRTMVWKLASQFGIGPSYAFCPEAAAGGRGMVFRLLFDPSLVLRVVNGQVVLATETAGSAFGTSTAFEAVALARSDRADLTKPIVRVSPALAQGGQLAAGTTIKLQVDGVNADSIRSATFFDDSAPGLTAPEELGVRTRAPFAVDWTPSTPGRHRISVRVRMSFGRDLSSDVTEVLVAGPNVAPEVLLVAPGQTNAGIVKVLVRAQDRDGRLTRIELLKGGEVIRRPEPTGSAAVFLEDLWLAAGSHTLTMRATDDQGATTESAPFTIQVAASSAPLPEARWLSPSQGGLIRAHQPLSLRAFAQDLATDQPALASASVVAVRDGDTVERLLQQQEAIASASGEFQFELPPGTFQPGTYSLYFAPVTRESSSFPARAASTVRSAPLRLTVLDPATPVAMSLTVPDTLALNASTTLGVTGLTITAADPVVRVDFLDDSGVIGSDTTVPYTLEWQGRSVGKHALQARAVLRSGAVLASELRGVLVQRSGNLLPTASITAPRAGATAGPGGFVTVEVVASDADGAVHTVYLYEGETLLAASQRRPNGSPWSFSVPLAAGVHTLSARALDSDQEMGPSTPVTFTAGHLAPTVELKAPSSAVAGQLVVLSTTPGDVDGVVGIVDFYDGAQLIGTRMRYPWAMSWVATAGTHQFTARVRDIDGGEGLSAVRSMSVKASNSPPKLGLSGVVNGAILVPGTPVTLTTNPGDSDGWITRVDFYDGATLIGSRTSRPWTMAWVPTVGTHVLTAQATDNDGAVSAPAAVTVSAKTGGNVPPKARITAPAAGTSVAAGTAVTLTSNPGDTDGWITRLEFYDGATLIGTRSAKPWSIGWTGAVGAHALTVKVFDNEGASSVSAPLAMTVAP